MACKPESLSELFDAVKAKFPASLEPDRWYLVAVSKHTLPTHFAVTDYLRPPHSSPAQTLFNLDSSIPT